MEKPKVFAGIGSNEVYEVDITDTFTEEQAKVIGKRAEACCFLCHNGTKMTALSRQNKLEGCLTE